MPDQIAWGILGTGNIARQFAEGPGLPLGTGPHSSPSLPVGFDWRRGRCIASVS